MTMAAIVSTLCNYCNVLGDDGMSYGDHVEQFTVLSFLKMTAERTKKPFDQAGQCRSALLAETAEAGR